MWSKVIIINLNNDYFKDNISIPLRSLTYLFEPYSIKGKILSSVQHKKSQIT